MQKENGRKPRLIKPSIKCWKQQQQQQISSNKIKVDCTFIDEVKKQRENLQSGKNKFGRKARAKENEDEEEEKKKSNGK